MVRHNGCFHGQHRPSYSQDSHRQTGVATAIDEQWFALVFRKCEDLTDENAMIATVIGRGEAAIKGRDGGAEEWRSRTCGRIRHTTKRRSDEGGAIREPVGEKFIVLRQDIDSERPRLRRSSE